LEADLEKERILVVDDEAIVRSVVVALLGHAGYATSEAATASEALELLQHGPPCNVVMSDVMMPGTDGLALLDAIKRDFPAIPVVLFTALPDLHMATNAFRRGAFDYLLKPFERKDLIATAERALDAAREQRRTHLYRQNLEEVVSERTQRLRSAMADLERSYDVTLEAMGDALDLRDEETEGHSKRVTAYCIALARAVGVDAAAMKIIARGAFLHDIGKIATPDAILLKPGKLTPGEMAVMREHCQRGYDMVRKIPFLLEAAEIVRAHQEKFDGTGYPQGLRGKEIPLGARIFAIADALDAITSDRPYRMGTSFQHAREEIERCAGHQFDPEIVAAFLALPRGLWSDIRAEVGKNSHCGEVLRGAAA
jgi:putative nucleotidyltransferase with HDIG domain